MIHIDFKPDDFRGEKREWWDRWLALVAKLEEPKKKKPRRYREAVWKTLKKWLLKEVFHGKCAYCESNVTGTGFGHADHYRPKGRVTVRQDDGSEIAVSRDGEVHPGYYWLAYHWKNILPACELCNTEGKGCQFPVANEHAFGPENGRDPDLLDELEQPLLLHPYNEKERPESHICFGVKGAVAERNGSTTGKASLETYGLRRPELVRLRQESQEKARLKYFVAAAHGGFREASEVREIRERGHATQRSSCRVSVV